MNDSHFEFTDVNSMSLKKQLYKYMYTHDQERTYMSLKTILLGRKTK